MPQTPLPLPTAMAGEVTGWRALANCRGADTDLFHPPRGRSFYASPGYALCAACPVRRDCLAEAIANGEREAIWGGYSPKALRAIRAHIDLEPTRRAAILDAAAECHQTVSTFGTVVPVSRLQRRSRLSDGTDARPEKKKASVYTVLRAEHRTDASDFVIARANKGNYVHTWAVSLHPETLVWRLPSVPDRPCGRCRRPAVGGVCESPNCYYGRRREPTLP